MVHLLTITLRVGDELCMFTVVKDVRKFILYFVLFLRCSTSFQRERERERERNCYLVSIFFLCNHTQHFIILHQNKQLYKAVKEGTKLNMVFEQQIKKLLMEKQTNRKGECCLLRNFDIISFQFWCHLQVNVHYVSMLYHSV